MPSPPAIVVHSLDHAVAALRAAAAADCAVTLVSAPEAGIYAGAGWFAALVALAGDAVPAARFRGVLDCGDDAGAAMAAIRAGVATVVFTGPADTAGRLAEIAAASGGDLVTERPDIALDLGDQPFADAETLARRIAGVLTDDGSAA